jgi:hypothetical protein
VNLERRLANLESRLPTEPESDPRVVLLLDDPHAVRIANAMARRASQLPNDIDSAADDVTTSAGCMGRCA